MAAKKPGYNTIARKLRQAEADVEGYRRDNTVLRSRMDDALRAQNDAIRESDFFREIVRHLIGAR